MTTHDQTEDFSSQYGCERLPAKKAKAAELETFIDKETAEIERIEGELRALRAQPGSPARDSKLTPLGDALEGWHEGRSQKTRELSRLTDEIRDLESRCIKQT